MPTIYKYVCIAKLSQPTSSLTCVIPFFPISDTSYSALHIGHPYMNNINCLQTALKKQATMLLCLPVSNLAVYTSVAFKESLGHPREVLATISGEGDVLHLYTVCLTSGPFYLIGINNYLKIFSKVFVCATTHLDCPCTYSPTGFDLKFI